MKTNGLYPTCSLSQILWTVGVSIWTSHTSYLWPWQNQDAWETAPPPPLSEQAAPCILQYQHSQCWVSLYNFALHGSHPSTHCENVSIVYWVADIQEIRLEAEHRPLPYLTPHSFLPETFRLQDSFQGLNVIWKKKNIWKKNINKS